MSQTCYELYVIFKIWRKSNLSSGIEQTPARTNNNFRSGLGMFLSLQMPDCFVQDLKTVSNRSLPTIGLPVADPLN